MNTSYYIDKAIHAINTDQPNLAMLYMKRGIVESKRNHPNPMLDLKYGLRAFAEAINEVGRAFERAGALMFEALRPIAEIYSGYYPDDFALVN
jgi:hypothetical protein